MSKRAILYSRVSTPAQAKLYSLDYQLEQEREYAQEMGFDIVAEFKDDQSARKMERDGLTEARDMLSKNEADVLVVWKLDRLHRNYVNSVLLRDELKKLGKELHFAQMRVKSSNKAKENLPLDILSLMAEIEADEIAERTALGKRRKAEQGGKWIGLNRPPYGYQTNGKGREAQVVINEETASVVRDIYNWYIFEELTTWDICQRLSALSVPTPLDLISERIHQKTRGYAQWNRSAIQRILKNPAYKGTYYHFTHKSIDGKVYINQNKNEWVAISIPAILDEETFQAAQERLSQNKQFAVYGAKFKYLLSRRLWCECGYKMRSSVSGSDWSRKDGTIKRYRYQSYRCPGRRGKQAVIRSCDMPRISTEKLDKRVWEYIRTEIANPVILERKLREIQSVQYNKHSGVNAVLESLTENKLIVEAEIKRLITLFAKEEIPRKILDDLLAEETDKLNRIDDEIRKSVTKYDTPLTEEIIESLISFSEEFERHLEAVEESFVSKRTVIDGLDTKVTVFRKNGELWLKIETLLSPKATMLPLISNSCIRGISTHKIALCDVIRF